MKGENIRNFDDCDLERANAFLDAALKHFDYSYLAKHYLISGVSRLSKKYCYKQVLNVLFNISEEEAERIKTTKSDDAINMVANILDGYLTQVA